MSKDTFYAPKRQVVDGSPLDTSAVWKQRLDHRLGAGDLTPEAVALNQKLTDEHAAEISAATEPPELGQLDRRLGGQALHDSE